MEMLIDFPGGARVDAHFRGFTVCTDQPPSGGGEDSAPSPFELFLTSLGTCAGIYVLGFCKSRGIDAGGIRLVQRLITDPASRQLTEIEIDIQTPAGFPEKYLPALIRAAAMCKVKQVIEHPPQFTIKTSALS